MGIRNFTAAVATVFVLSSCGSEYIIDCEACPEISITEQEYFDNLARKDEKIRDLEAEVLSWRASNNQIGLALANCIGNLADCDLALASCATGKAYCRKTKEKDK